MRLPNLSPAMTRTAFAVLAAVILISVIAVAAVGQGPNAGYRTATAESRAVEQTLDEVGTVAAATEATVSFPVAGTIATVQVAAGDAVAVGQVLATLDTASLEADLHEAQAALDQAELALERALDGEDPGGGGTGGGGGTIPVSTSAGIEVELIAMTTAAGSEDELRAAQQGVLDGQKKVDVGLIAADEALASAKGICAALGEETPSSTSTTTTTTTSPNTATTTSVNDTDEAAACYDALESAFAAQEQLNSSQHALAAAATALDQLLAERASETPTAPAPSGSTTTVPSGSHGADQPSAAQRETPSGAADVPSGSTGTAPTSSPSSEDLIAYQAAVDAAALDVIVAERALEQASIVSPIDGTVLSVGLQPGNEVTADSDTANVVIDGDAGYEVTAIVAVDRLPDLELGQAATVTPDGTDVRLTGEIVAIGLVPSSESSDSSYPMTIGLTGAVDDLRIGSVASISIVTDENDNALSVPTSAIRVQDGEYSVIVIDGDTTETVTVEVGAIGATWTEIRSGLERGDTVVIADLDEPLPGSATDSSGGGAQTGTFGRFGGPQGN